jgi:hypothetical protein
MAEKTQTILEITARLDVNDGEISNVIEVQSINLYFGKRLEIGQVQKAKPSGKWSATY